MLRLLGVVVVGGVMRWYGTVLACCGRLVVSTNDQNECLRMAGVAEMHTADLTNGVLLICFQVCMHSFVDFGSLDRLVAGTDTCVIHSLHREQSKDIRAWWAGHNNCQFTAVTSFQSGTYKHSWVSTPQHACYR